MPQYHPHQEQDGGTDVSEVRKDVMRMEIEWECSVTSEEKEKRRVRVDVGISEGRGMYC